MAGQGPFLLCPQDTGSGRRQPQNPLVSLPSRSPDGRWIPPAGADQPLAQWAEEFLALARRLSTSTQETYRRVVVRYVLPRFGSYRLGRLPADEIENWLNDEVAAGVAPSSVHRHYRTLRRVLQVAGEAEDRCQSVRPRQPPRVPQREMTFLAWEEAVALAEAINDATGRCYLAVDSVRSITVSPVTAELLAAHLERFSAPGPDGLVFPNKAGNPLIASSFWQHYFRPALFRAGASCRFHDLRHTSVALAIAEGAHPRRSRPEWGTRRSTSPSTATCSASTPTRSRRGSTRHAGVREIGVRQTSAFC